MWRKPSRVGRNKSCGGIALRAAGLAKLYPPANLALRGVDFALQRGEIRGLLGANGAGFGTVLLRVTLPLVRPGLIVTSMFAFVFAWNNAAFPLVLSSQRTATLPIGTLGYFATSGATWTYIGAAAVAAMLPPMLIFLALDRYVVRGLTFGSVKG